MYTAIYSRVSTGMQAIEGTSLEDQIEICTKKAKELGISGDLQIYKEEGFTGEDIDRPILNGLRRDFSSGKVRQLIVTHPDRLTRDLTDKLILCRELERFGVELIFVDTEYRNTPEGQLFFNLMSSIAQYELALIKKRTIRGRLNAVKKEKKVMPMRVPPFGYEYQQNKLEINEQEAAFVKQIYRWYVFDNLTLRQIGDRLFSLGVVPKRGESLNWSASSIRRVLTSEIYIGKYFYNRRQTRKLRGERTKTGAPKKSYDFRDKQAWIEVAVPAIIDEQLFELAQIQREKNTIKSGNVKYEYLFKSKIRCGHCGRLWQATTYTGRVNKKLGQRMKYTCYRCPNLYPKKYGEGVEKCPTHSIRSEELDEYIWQLIMSKTSKPDDFIQGLLGQSGEMSGELQTEMELIIKHIAQKEREKEKIKTMFRLEVIDETEMTEELHNLTLIINELKQKQIELEKNTVIQFDESWISAFVKEMFKEVNQLVGKQGSELSFEDRQKIVDTFVDHIIIKQEGQELHITAAGIINEFKKQRFLSYESDIGSCSYHLDDMGNEMNMGFVWCLRGYSLEGGPARKN